MTARIVSCLFMLAIGLGALAPVPALAGGDCTGVRISIENASDRAVQVFDLGYYDAGTATWRSRPTARRNLNRGAAWEGESTLADVDNAAIKLRVRYRILTRNHRWEGAFDRYSGPVLCQSDGRITLTIR